jgi:hypothetical protein
MRWVAFCLLLAGCHTPERAVVQPLPPDTPLPSYTDLVGRAKAQVSAAQEFFYRDSWGDVEQAADALRQTATLLTKLDADNVPEKQQAALTKLSKDLTDAATALHAAGQAKDVVKTTEAFQKLHLTIRGLRPD